MRQIGSHLNRHQRAIARELKRNTQQTYQAKLADEWAEQHGLVCHQKGLKSEQLIPMIQKYLERT